MTEEYLMKIRSLRKEQWYLTDRIRELNEDMCSLKSPSMEPSYGTNGSDSLTGLIENRDKLREQLLDKLMEIMDAEVKVEDALVHLSSEERMIIRLYYLKAYPNWDAVADELQYSIQRVYQFRESALKRLEQIRVN